MNRVSSLLLAPSIPRLAARGRIYKSLLICWIINVFVVASDIVLLKTQHISWIDSNDYLLTRFILILICISFVGWVVSRVPVLSGIGRRIAWFFHILAMNWVFSISGVVLTYLVAAARLPLVDGFLHQTDLVLGFHWHAFSQWVENRPTLAFALRWAYNSLEIQSILTIFLLIGEDEIGKAIDFSLAAMICAVIITGISVVLPAYGYAGEIGRPHIVALIHARQHALEAISVGKITGIVTFPSFHAAMGVIIAYTMRTRLWRAILFIPLNVLLIVGTLPVGGHYLIDTIAGCMVAAAVLYALAERPAGAPSAA